MDSADPNLSSVSSLGLLFLIVMAVLTLTLPRKHAVIPLLITTCYMPLGQMFVVAGAHIQFFRVLLFLGWCRVIIKGEAAGLKLGRMDKVFIWWAVVTLVLGSLTQPAVFSERLFNRCGEVYNSIGAFFLIRCWIRNLDELIAISGIVALMVLPMALSMLLEKYTGRNIFYVFGGVPEITQIREGKLRCQGAFRHPILAGTFGATLFPMFVGLWLHENRRSRIAVIGIISSVFITIAAASSGPLLALIGAVIGFAIWPFRYHMRLLRRGIVLSLILLAMVMEAPVWYIIARVSDVTGGTGWYRSYLIDQAIRHFDEWWLVGTRYTAHWAPGGEVVSGNAGNTDVIDNYVAEGLDGGILKLGLFIALIVTGFKIVGRFTYADPPISRHRHIFIWSLGICLLGHCLSFFSVSYFDQIVVFWYWLLACLATVAFELPSSPALLEHSDLVDETLDSPSAS